MARPTKTGLDYFPLDTTLDDKIELIEAKYGITGFGLIIKLFQRIYQNGYYYDWTEKQQLLLSKDAGVDVSTVKNIVYDAVNWGLFHQKLYKSRQILTSKGIQLRYLAATKKRVQVEINQNYSLINPEEWDNVELIEFPEEETGFPEEESIQSKVKKSKVKNNRSLPSDVEEDESEDESENEEKPDYPDWCLEVSEQFHAYQHQEHPTLLKQVNEQVILNGADQLDKLERIDGYTPETIEEALQFAVMDEFWQLQIISLNGIRKKSKSNGNMKFVNLLASMQQRGSNHQRKQRQEKWRQFLEEDP